MLQHMRTHIFTPTQNCLRPGCLCPVNVACVHTFLTSCVSNHTNLVVIIHSPPPREPLELVYVRAGQRERKRDNRHLNREKLPRAPTRAPSLRLGERSRKAPFLAQRQARRSAPEPTLECGPCCASQERRPCAVCVTPRAGGARAQQEAGDAPQSHRRRPRRSADGFITASTAAANPAIGPAPTSPALHQVGAV